MIFPTSDDDPITVSGFVAYQPAQHNTFSSMARFEIESLPRSLSLFYSLEGFYRTQMR